MANANVYDYIIAGAGASGLSLLLRMLREPVLQDKKILLIDQAPKTANDRTWCFWEAGPGFFEEVVYRRWDKIAFHHPRFSRELTIAPYQYKMIRGGDFYRYCFDRIAGDPRVTLLFGSITALETESARANVTVNGERFTAPWVFSSLLLQAPPAGPRDIQLLQHFKGWVVETEQPVFDPALATFMDFRTDQAAGTTFVYVMPFSPTRALVEYTLFTEALLSQEAYEQGLHAYIREQLGNPVYRVEDEEFGIIPMTTQRFPVAQGRVVYLGTAGGQTKGSSGYTFQFIQKHAAAICRRLQRGLSPVADTGIARFRFYDRVLLDVLGQKRLPGDRVFADLFEKNKPQRILRFLDNESSLPDELRLISSLPTAPFLKAALRQR